jgi:putative DNA primase/helicase
MCSDDDHPERLFRWVLRWVAYPIQHPGAKMRTTLVLHGPQGTGKNLFFEALMAIYGPYGRIIDQSSIEDKFNDWASRKLFLIADEVVARSDLFHVKNKLKAFITGTWIRINPKNVAARDERNHVNMVFLSNEPMPVALEEDDRRHAVIWTPSGLAPDFYAAVAEEIDAGGVAALHDYLLHLDLGDFHENTKPPYTDAKEELINLGRDSPTRFYNDLLQVEIGTVPFVPALAKDAYGLYKHYCAEIGVRAAPMPKFVNALVRKHQVGHARRRYLDGMTVRGPHGVLFFGQAEPPEGVLETTWLGESIEAFRNAVSDYRGEKSP